MAVIDENVVRIIFYTVLPFLCTKHVAEIASLKEAISQERDLHRETQQKLALLEKVSL